MFKHILVPTDGSALSANCITQAITFAREAGARITFLCSEPAFPSIYCGLGAIIDPHTPAKFHEEIDSVARELLDSAEKQALAAGVECAKQTLVSAEPNEAIIVAAERHGCDLICMASHQWHGLSAWVHSSETQKVLALTKIPVLVYH